MKRLFQVIEKRFKLIAVFFIVLILVAFFDRTLVIGLIFLAFLFTITYLILEKLKIGGRKLFWLLVIVFIIHLIATIAFYYFDFQPFSGGIGGYKNTHIIASELSSNFRSGNFSFENIPFYQDGKYPYRFYSLLIGMIYTFTVPEIIIGGLFQVWLAILATIFIYLIIKKLKGSDKVAFWLGLIVNFYPSYLFYGTVLQKDALVTPLILMGLLFCLKLIEKFSWKSFLVLYLSLILLFNFRFYVAYALSLSFLISWILLSSIGIKKRLVYAAFMIILIGLLPQVIHGHGFFGIDLFQGAFTTQNISFYQEKAYVSPTSEIIPTSSSDSGSSDGFSSTWERKSVSFRESPAGFVENYSKGFSYILLGPFPWQMNKTVHYFALLETVPWYILLLFILNAFYQSIKRHKKLAIPLILFAVITLGVVSVFINNYGIVTRIRIPAFISLICLIPLGFRNSMQLMKIDE